jgi:biopolymer transport protein ExbB/TolQ
MNPNEAFNAPAPLVIPEQADALVAYDLSPLRLFLDADPVVQGVMLLLAAASVGCWALIIDRGWRLSTLRRDLRRFEMSIGVASQPPSIPQTGSVARKILEAGHHEAQFRDSGETAGEARHRCERAMKSALAAGLRPAEWGLPFLATIGSSAPFIGLFGTVWGIMNSFSAIAVANDTSLRVVAPGIAEALSATALGLVAAIPAVVAYNKLAVSLNRIAARFTAGIEDLARRFTRRPDQAAQQWRAAE